MPTTEDNLKTAFAGESQANRKYLAFAQKADQEKMPNVARMFKAIAEAETVHALNHLRAMGGVKSTKENMEAALGGENYEVTKMYPPMVETAKKEGKKAAEQTTSFALATEKVHEVMYKKALESVKAGKDIPKTTYWVCPVCGLTFEGDFASLPDKCPVEGTVKAKFIKFE